MKPPPSIPLAEDSTAPDSERLGVVLPRLVRLSEPILQGAYCQFFAGEEVKVTPCGEGWTVERAEWRNSLTICNVLYNVPSWQLILEDEPNGALSNGGTAHE